MNSDKASRFEAKLHCPAKPGKGSPWARPWAFPVLPKTVSEKLPRRGRTTVKGTINNYPFHATLEPDGRLSHWLKLDQELLTVVDAVAGGTVSLDITPLEPEPEPEVPSELGEALEARPDAKKVWEATTTIARLDWIHWITSAKQEKTRKRRIKNACEMLASGKRRVCCFDPSGFYSKSFGAPRPADVVKSTPWQNPNIAVGQRSGDGRHQTR